MTAPRFALSRSAGRTPEPRVEVDRRAALAALGAGAAAGLAGCAPPREPATPYVTPPEGGVAGIRRRYATTLTLAGYGRGVTGISYDGRPIKLEGNDRHPASLGATDVFAEAAILDLYDPYRLKASIGPAGVTDWETLAEGLRGQMSGHAGDRGRGLALVTGRITSPTMLRLIQRLKTAYPEMSWTAFESVHDDNARGAVAKAYGAPVERLPRYADVDVALWLGADPLGPGPRQIAVARFIADRRRPAGQDGSKLSRLYAAEATLSQSGAMADHRLTAAPAVQASILVTVARVLGANLPPRSLPPAAQRFADAVAADLAARRGRALVEVGRAHPPEVHALAIWVNDRLAAPIDVHEDVDAEPASHGGRVRDLANRLQSSAIRTLVVLDANLAFHVRAITETIPKVPFSLWLGSSIDETAALCRWRAPLSHPLESWSDARSPDGAASVGQPLVRPLYASRSAAQVLALMAGDLKPDDQVLVRETWPQAADDTAWRAALASGVIEAAHAPLTTAPAPPPPVLPAQQPSGLALEFIPHPTLWDGRYADNAWLQECPDPITKETWGSALRLSAVDARKLGLHDHDRARLHANGAAVEVSIRIVGGQAEGVATLPLGGGRRVAGPIGKGVGADAASVRGPELAWSVKVERIERLGGPMARPLDETTFTLDAETATLAPTLTVAGLRDRGLPKPEPAPTLLPTQPKADHAWAMVIDTAACIGCNACVTACQSENNIPVVGPAEVAAGRDMHWLRIDRYDPGPSAEEPQPVFSPTPCMQCEHAPCEPVCPVEASVHDHEGLNDQVYNRCVGTRFCQANCPYKVRRFNWRDYQAPRLYPDLDAEALKAQRNPDVTVRARGVMEKCTYCTQRIQAAKIDSERTGAPIADGSLKTACQSACPTQAITFGDLNDPTARVNALRAEPRHFALLEGLGTRPRTTYLAKVRNPNPALERPA